MPSLFRFSASIYFISAAGKIKFRNPGKKRLTALSGQPLFIIFSDDAFGITAKEMELIELVADGLSNKEIAEKLFLSEGTVRNYLSSILEKLDLRDRTQLAVFYYKNLK